MIYLDALAEAEVGKFNVAINVEEDVFWLDVSKNNLLRVQVVKGLNNFGKVKLSIFFRKPKDLSQMEKHLSTGTDVHHEKQFFLALETPVEPYDEWVVEV